MIKKENAVVLFSGGLDSTTTLAIAMQKYNCYCLSFNYGQKQKSELIAAQYIAKKFKVKKHIIMQIALNSISDSALINNNISVPNFNKNNNGIPITYVPARNTIFLSYALALAENINANNIFIGVNNIDYSGYPDCRPEYIKAYEIMANLATKNGVNGLKINIKTPLINLNKAQIIQKGINLGIDYSLTISCYQADKNGKACGSCDACQYRKLGFKIAKITDPTKYI